jgi:hypothetical protein
LETDFDPQNEGEISTYRVKFLPKSDIPFNSEMVFIFPQSFDMVLGNKIACSSLSGLSEVISCTRLSNRVLYIDGVSSYQVSPDRPIKIEIRGVINPNKLNSNSQPIGLGILSKGTTSFVDYAQSAITIDPIKAPGWAFFFSFESSNTKCRYNADYTFNFNAAASIPKLSSNGAVILDLPKQFDIEQQISPCTSFSPAFGTAMNCLIQTNRVWITGNTNDYSGNIVMKVRKVKNPVDEVVSDNFIISTYDGINKKILERSYENLDPFYKTFTYPGPKIIINDNKPITVIRGTQSDLIPIYIEDIAALNITLRPVVKGINIIPYNVDIQIGQLYRYFRVSAPNDLSVGNYTVDWVIMGELVPPIYTPIKQSLVVVTKQDNLLVSIDEISNIPFGGTSMPVFITIPKSPDIGISVVVNMKKAYQGIRLSTNSINFDAGSTQGFFKIYFDDIKAATKEALTTGALDLQLFGVNKGLYKMQKTSLTFTIMTQDVVEPVINSLVLNSVERTSANFTLTVSEPCFVYYMIALAGTKIPSREYLQARGELGPEVATVIDPKSNNTEPAYYVASTKARFFQAFIFDSLTTTFIVDDLNPTISYTLYVMLQDRGSKYSKITTLNFNTKDRDPAADVSIKLKQSYISEYDKGKILGSIALILSLDASRVVVSKYDFTQRFSNQRLLPMLGTGLELFTETSVEGSSKIEGITALLSFNILSIVNSEVYPSPKILGGLLNKKNIEMSARIDNLDLSYTIPSTDFVKYLPNFVTPPSLHDYDWKTAIVTTRFDNFGWLYAVAIERESKNRSNAEPTPLQISMGVDSQNLPVPAGFIEISKTYEYFYLYVNGLKSETKYSIYVIGANAHPGYPDLMDSKFIKKIDFTSKVAPEGTLILNI